MNYNPFQWTFKSEQTANKFNEHVEKSVPFYKEIHKIVKIIGGFFVEDDTNVYDIGSSTGNLLKGMNNILKRNANYIGIDNSIYMNQVAMNDVDSDNIKIISEDVQDFKFTNASYITSILTLQFINIEDREKILKNVYQGLNKGGAFILVEKVNGEFVQSHEIMNQIYHDFKLENGLTYEEVIKKSQSIRGVLKPLTLKQNKRMLEEAGFKDIDTWFKWNNFVGIIAVK
ncbi:methyltransferase domain-containing protein [Staphylococcus hominis]|uniref:methyltransferase domain-containing protein n=1 Tax=Staphylococcus hominis TaxID=1290 RepID=UPI0010E678BB|nr:methyltransferase domain-containing protein [Staphylococcus hominis]MCI2852873.1 methyltransferase domain-containing protein [Staphylococcus hominis]TBW92662.1 methyltransferase domain-containing protein [Staphylococcus hominis]UNQ69102.1 methyltransferase domain-containing protein [Staphylococcus hominis]